MDLSQYHGKKISVILPLDDREQLLIGKGCYDHDDALGPVLRIIFEEAPGEETGNPELMLIESEWKGEITVDTQYGGDFCVRLV